MPDGNLDLNSPLDFHVHGDAFHIGRTGPGVR
jgi:hypothetical protein